MKSDEEIFRLILSRPDKVHEMDQDNLKVAVMYLSDLMTAPDAFWNNFSNQNCDFLKLVNGCGPENLGGWKREILGWFAPDYAWGLPILLPCWIHDYQYGKPERQTEEFRNLADRTFRDNLLRLIDKFTRNWFLRRLRRGKALIYYRLVDNYGGQYFHLNKCTPREKLQFVPKDQMRA